MRRRIAICLLLALLSIFPAIPAAAQAVAPSWRDTGLATSDDALICYDPRRPTSAIIADTNGTVAYDWRSGAQQIINPRRATFCTPNGTLYAPEGDGAWRFSLDDMVGRSVARQPTIATDDPEILYAAAPDSIWASEDGGLTWVLRSVAITPSRTFVARNEPRKLYQLHTIIDQKPDDPTGRTQVRSFLFFSSNGGVSWNQLDMSATGFCHYVGVSIDPVPGAPTLLLQMTKWCSDHPGSGFSMNYLLSRDGGYTFEAVGSTGGHSTLQIVNTPVGLLRYRTSVPFALSTDEGRTWRDLEQPRIDDVSSGGLPFLVAPGDASTVVLRDAGSRLWYSTDSGSRWQRAEGYSPASISVSPSVPPAVLGKRDGTLRVLELAPPADQRCFAETGFCISGRLRRYWEQNGGLPVFGYPIGPQMPLSVEGRTVTGQWFERNRLELHPENTAPYDVLLGRLGEDTLVARGVDWRSYPAAPADAAHRFAETGQAIAPEFWSYWSSHGLEFDGRRGTSFNESLALFGMPLTPPIQEISRTDGNTYLTQYFERARFEYHPENEGTPYVVLLGLLGSEQRK